MNLKKRLLDLNKTYTKMEKEVSHIVETLKPRVKKISDALAIQSLIEGHLFYLKHDLAIIRKLAKDYKIEISELEKICEEYVKIEQILLGNKSKFERLGLKNVTFGPFTLLSAYGDKKSEISIHPIGNQLNITISRQFDGKNKKLSKDFEKFAKELRNQIQNLVENVGD